MKFFATILLAGILLHGCSLQRITKSKRIQDSTAVKKIEESRAAGDTGRTEKTSHYTREVLYLPGRDTVINNYFNQPAGTIWIRETGTTRETDQKGNFDNWQKNFLDSLAFTARVQETKKKPDALVKILAVLFGASVLFNIIMYIKKISYGNHGRT